MDNEVHPGISLIAAIVWCVVIFILSSIVEAIITMFIFKKFGGCPLQPKVKKLTKKL